MQKAAEGAGRSGSSPLTRGKPRTRSRMGLMIGLIPAHAGKTRRRRPTRPLTRAHPRSRGENGFSPSGFPSVKGSSPLTRGKHVLAGTLGNVAGLIPAHAGKTAAHSIPTLSRTAHPRSRGENLSPMVGVKDGPGSSPLTRGKRLDARPHGLNTGLIPAHAGKTDRARRWVAAHRAHPRSRGENAVPEPVLKPGRGSSPLTRGKQLFGAGDAGALGLIPAHAGKTSPDGSKRRVYRAHPRSRGENVDKTRVLLDPEGSSPLTRGKPRSLALASDPRRLIPAHAGKTCPCGECHVPTWAHPRSRGENRLHWCRWALVVGSSPLTRGKPHRVPGQRGERGLIPAHAGKTYRLRVDPGLQWAHPRSRGENFP